VNISLRLSEPDGSKVSPITEIVMHLPAGMVRNFAQFPTCATLALQSNPKACPRDSKVGSGTALFDARPIISEPLPAKVTAFNGENGELLLHLFPALGPPIVIVGTPSDGPAGPVLTFAVPPVHTLPDVPDASLFQLLLSLGETLSPGGACGYGFGYGYGYECPSVPAQLELKPKTATNPVDTQHCVTATVKDVIGSPVAHVSVTFTVSGSVKASGTEPTNDSGEATFCYPGPPLPGSDKITAVAGA
jgi:Bacterial Ig-like domain (group 1)